MATVLKVPSADTPAIHVDDVREELLDRARALVPVLRQRAAETEALGRIPDATVKDIVDAGLLRASVAVAYGGYVGAEYDLTLEIAMILGRGCPSTAWCYAIWANHNLTLSLFQEETRAAYYASGPDVIGSTARMCIYETLALEEGGLRLSGQYNFSSGCQHAEWFIVMTKNWIGVLLHRDEIEILENWEVLGLKGTGSNGIVVKDILVPPERIWGLFDASTASPPAFMRNQRFSDAIEGPMLAYTALSTVVGAALGAVDVFIEANKGKATAPMSDYGAGDAVSMQMHLAESAAEAEAAHSLLLADCRWLIEQARNGNQIGPVDRARIRRNHAYISKIAVSAATRLFDTLGGRGIVQDNIQQRYFRDAIAASHHATLPKDRLLEIYGKTMLGFEAPRDHVGAMYHPSLVMDMFADMMG